MSNLIKILLREALLKERPISDISLKDFNTKHIIQNWLYGNAETIVGNFKYEMQDDYYLSPEEKEEIMDADEDDLVETDRFKKWIKYEVEYRIDDAIDAIKEHINNGMITIWRKMTVDDKWLKNLPTTGKRLGRYWSWEEGAAEAHWGDGTNNKITLETTVREDYIDWQQTIEANIDPSLGEDEKEITLFKNTPIKINRLLVNDKEIDISKIKDKTFKALYMNDLIKILLREALIKEDNDIWYHGTPDVRELESDGGFTERTITSEYVEDISKYHEIQKQLAPARESGDEDKYHELLNSMNKLRKTYTIRKPIFLTNNYGVAKTYANPQRAFDYQGAEEKVLKVNVNVTKGVKINAPGSRFRFIDLNKVKQGFTSAGINEDEFNKTFEKFNFHIKDKTKIKTDSIAVLAEYFKFEYVDVVGVLDSYHGGTTKSTVRMVFDPTKINIIKEDMVEGFENKARTFTSQKFDMGHLLEKPATGVKHGEEGIWGKAIKRVTNNGNIKVSYRDATKAYKAEVKAYGKKKAGYQEIESYRYWEQISTPKITPRPNDRKLIDSIINQAKRNFDLVTDRQMEILKRAEKGQLKPEDYHPKN